LCKRIAGLALSTLLNYQRCVSFEIYRVPRGVACRSTRAELAGPTDALGFVAVLPLTRGQPVGGAGMAPFRTAVELSRDS
jgi:hypothetical protein